ncbi:NAD(P)-dependent oxidoreductase [Lichenifustis flavocetrariae]|uniref:NAD(P)-dependent oxidoreductase n=1 Tax=Lichenifustis flavocetrariae TaxID=2949735 RepID=A0AA42CLV6_9HYPH|nr:NAD(P)-dependent oxidoreductase [Lichenifustis flavocetrariae]MCW6507715.1 NAD(P)-dependent oxidoreductase [Lichenifustis flavocetrariae]
MRILLTGASSFTGAWFATALVQAGHTVTAPFRGTSGSYEGARGQRVKSLGGLVEPIWGLSFGDERFQDLVASQSFDLFCHHAAEMTDYRSWSFDSLAATAANTRNARPVLERLVEKGCAALIVTGSVFEPFEGLGDPQHRSFNPYGLSKHLSFEVLRLEAERLKLAIGKFVIPNPFGPREEFRFTSFLAREWIAGRVPKVATPAYVRDNIPVSLLTRSYVDFVTRKLAENASLRGTPSGYIEDQGAFAHRVARELAPRLGCPCPVELAVQTDFLEPLVRVNDQRAPQLFPDWSESGAWDDLAAYYKTVFS